MGPYEKNSVSVLELKIPPPIVGALTATAMWLLSLVTPSLKMPSPLRLVAALVLAMVGLTIAFAGFIAFNHAKTTVNPTKPEKSTSLVTSGIYKITRNPMYVGLVLVLVAWAVQLSAPWTLAGPLAFVLYIVRFQIRPEERVLLAMFGAEYSAYKNRVRRWL